MKFLGTVIALVMLAAPVAAQQPDLEITGSVRIRRLHVEKAPVVRVEFRGTPERDTVWRTTRHNLPEALQDGATYTNVGVDFVISSTFKEFDIEADLRK